MEEVDKGCLMIRMGMSGWMFLLVPVYLGIPGQRAVKRLCVCVCVCVCSSSLGWLSSRCCACVYVMFLHACPVRSIARLIVAGSLAAVHVDRTTDRLVVQEALCTVCARLRTRQLLPLHVRAIQRCTWFLSSSALAALENKLPSIVEVDHAFCVAAARIWNSLPPTVTSSATVNSFNRYLKTHFPVFFPSLTFSSDYHCRPSLS